MNEIEREVYRLASDLFNGTIDAEQHQRLQDLLTNQPEAVEVYLDCVQIEHHLRQWHGIPQLPPGMIELQQEMEHATTMASTGSQCRRMAFAAALGAALSISVMLLIQLWVGSTKSVQDVARDIAPSRTPAEAMYVATLSRAYACVWGKGDSLPQIGWRLSTGPVELESGLVELRFDSGAKLLLEGPATLDLLSANSAMLRQGKLVLVGSDNGESFVLTTPSSTLVDLGTEYGVEVSATGDSQVHVFDGLVQRSAADDRDKKLDSIAAGTARVYPRFGASGRTIACVPDRFARAVPMKEESEGSEDELWASDDFDYEGPHLPDPNGSERGIGWDGPWYLPETKNYKNGPVPLVAADDGIPGSGFDRTGRFLREADRGVLRRKLQQPIRLDVDGLFYCSFLVHRAPDANGMMRAAGVGFFDSTAEQHKRWPRCRLSVSLSGNSLLSGYLSDAGQSTSMPLENRAYRIVAKVVSGRDRPDQLLAAIFPADEPLGNNEPVVWTVVTPPFSSGLVLDVVNINFGPGVHCLDGLRIGPNWAAVTRE